LLLRIRGRGGGRRGKGEERRIVSGGEVEVGAHELPGQQLAAAALL